MKTQPLNQLLLIACLVGMLAACTPIQAPATTSTPAETVTVPAEEVGSSRVDLQACKLEYSIVSPK